jgi:TDG/mug DNA glycosylase family protein
MPDIHSSGDGVMETTTCIGFPAQLNAECRVLILGSMPGVASLQAAQYYAHPRNRFWPLMGVLCGIDTTLPYPDRVRALNARGVGVWDVIGQCERRGSLDASIVRGSEVPNALGALIEGRPALRAIACNGGTAYRAFQRFIVPALLDAAREVPVWSLPSTSPANAAWPLPRLVEAWQPLADAIRL